MTAPLLECRYEDLGPGKGYRLVSVVRHALLDVPADWLPNNAADAAHIFSSEGK